MSEEKTKIMIEEIGNGQYKSGFHGDSHRIMEMLITGIADMAKWTLEDDKDVRGFAEAIAEMIVEIYESREGEGEE